MTYETVDALGAWQRTINFKQAHWAKMSGRFGDDPIDLAFTPKFTTTADSKVFCVGSCFARNIEEHLIYRHVDVLSKRVVCPKVEWPMRPNGFLNKFTTHSMAQEFLWLASPPADWESILCPSGDDWYDLLLSPGIPPATLERAIERRRYVTEDYFSRIDQADIVIVTLGLNEVWRDDETGVWLNGSPPYAAVAKGSKRYSFHCSDVADNIEQLELVYATIKSRNPAARLIVSVSPVPMGSTFSGEDIAIANTLSKTTLRAAAESFCRRHNDADYFPSFEMVSLMERHKAYLEDMIHVRDSVVGGIIGRAIREYFTATRDFDGEFCETPYLLANPDIEDRIRTGELTSGFEHWLMSGQAEGRKLSPETPVDL